MYVSILPLFYLHVYRIVFKRIQRDPDEILQHLALLRYVHHYSRHKCVRRNVSEVSYGSCQLLKDQYKLIIRAHGDVEQGKSSEG